MPNDTDREPIESLVDHLVWGCPELGAGIDSIAERMGARPIVGGRHPGIGTHNALLRLDGERYFEILARDPSQDALHSFGRFLIGVDHARLATWAASTENMDALAEAAKSAGLEPGPALAMSRQRPDGSVLSWRLMQIGGHAFGGLLPFFIEWGKDARGERVHACRFLPESGCRFVGLELHSPAPDHLRRDLLALGFRSALDHELHIHRATESRLQGRFEGPAGGVTIG